MTEEYPSSLQSSSSANEQDDTHVNSHAFAQAVQRASEDNFLTELEGWIVTAHNWMDIAKGPVINVTLTELQVVEVKSVIATLEGVKKMYGEMNANRT